jgi:hypothetical protein
MAKSYYPTEDTHLNIARNLVRGTFGVHKQGVVPSMSQNKTGTLWGYNDTLYPWSAWDVGPNNITVLCSSNDVGKYITIGGLDENFDIVMEDILMTSTSVVSNTTFSRINSAIIHNDGHNNINDVVMNTNGSNVGLIVANTGQAMMGVYTVPAGHTAYVTKGAMTAQASADGTGDMLVRFSEGYVLANTTTGFTVAHSFEVSGVGGPYIYDFTIPQAIPEKSDIEVRVWVRTNNGRFTCAWDMIIIKNGLS